jgi:hypothetical protein
MTVHSRFLPADYDAGRPVALIAGQGDYPIRVATAMRAAGVPVRLIAFDEETRTELVESFPESERRTILVGQLGHMLSAMKDFGAGYALRNSASSGSSASCSPKSTAAPGSGTSSTS